jgi:hypothetical protein
MPFEHPLEPLLAEAISLPHLYLQHWIRMEEGIYMEKIEHCWMDFENKTIDENIEVDQAGTLLLFTFIYHTTYPPSDLDIFELYHFMN